MSTRPVPRIFVVDDEYVIASSLAAILKLNGFSAKFFTCPREALTAAGSYAPDLLISEVAMPGISGIDLAIQMRARFPTCKILLFSGQATTVDLLNDARAQGHQFDLLLKPAPPTEPLFEVARMKQQPDRRNLRRLSCHATMDNGETKYDWPGSNIHN
jgi:DNA-binding NtrC family response regulator